jgi:hypothetical protein
MKNLVKIAVCFGLVCLCFVSVWAEEAKGFSPKLLRVKIDDQILFEDGKANTIKVKVKAKKITIQYIFQNIGDQPAEQKYRVFIHFCQDAKSSVSIGGNFWPNRSTMKWKKDYKFVQNDIIHIKDPQLGRELMVFIGMFIKGRLKLANEGVDKQSRLFIGKVTFE